MGASQAGAAGRWPWWRPVVRGALGLTALFALFWLLRRGPMVAPVSTFAAYGSAAGFYTASHIVPLLALVGAGACLWGALDPRMPWPSSAALVALALPLAALALACAFAVYPHDAWLDFRLACAFAIFWCGLVVLLGTDGALLAALAALSALGDWQALAGLAQFHRGQPTAVGWTGAFADEIPVRITATLHNPNVLASVLLLTLGAACGLALAAPWRVLRSLALLAIVPIALALPLTFSRAAYLGVLALVAVAVLLLPRELRRRGAGVLAAFALPMFAMAVGVPGVLFRLHTISVQGGGDVQARFFAWRDALAIWRARPLLGAGAGGFNTLYARYHPLASGGTYVLIDVPGSPDSDPLQWLAETGVVGVLALAAGTALAVVAAWRIRRRRPAFAVAAIPLVGALAALALQGVFEVTAYVMPVEGLGALALAVLTGLGGQVRGAAHRRWRPLPLALALAGSLTAVSLMAGWAPQQQFGSGWTLVQAGKLAAALPHLRRAAAAVPGSERNAAALGDVAVRMAYADLQAQNPATGPLEALARSELLAALRIDPYDASVWAASGVLLELAGYGTAAVCAQQAAVRDSPDAPYQVFQLAVLLKFAHRWNSADANQAWAARLFPLQMAVYREYGDQATSYYRTALEDEQVGIADWGGQPLPAGPTYPYAAQTCRMRLTLAGIPGDLYGRAWAGA